ncbi:unnamed protein product [Paramecium pentaurelia]|uniref:Uncharacterized protein n=1 Tax=Paramecium pentaurelia TaxID=43138 RepID=A0A8S1WHR2_9CILI|nr:unnamed protein product [Paramecium pentaurelia]
MSHRQKRVKPGRPSKDDQKEGVEIQRSSDDENEYIADDSDCERIFSLLAKQSSYKNITKTGPTKTKKADEEQLAEASENVKKVLVDLQIEDPQFFFLSNQKRKYEFDNDKLVDKTEYKLIKKDEFGDQFKTLIHKINIVNKELDENFIDVLKEILIQYQDLVIQEVNSNTIIEKIIQTIKNPENQEKFQYLLTWQRLKSITKETRMNRAIEDLEEKRKEINKKTSDKVKKKHQEFIDSQKKELDEENSMDPLQYLITKLITAFDKIIGRFDQIMLQGLIACK